MPSKSQVCSRCRMRCGALLSQCNPPRSAAPPLAWPAFQHAAPPHRTVCTRAQARLLQKPNPYPYP